MRIALTREVSDGFAACELTHLDRVPIDVAVARAQHEGYERALAELGCEVRRLPAAANMPDSVFIEDMAVVLDEFALLTRPGAEVRRAEGEAVERALAPFRDVARIESPGTIDGGDVMVAGRAIYIGLSSRTNAHAIAQARAIAAAVGYTVHAVDVRGCLHLKSAVTVVDDGVLLVNPAWAPVETFAGFELIEVDPVEPHAANVVRVGRRLLFPTAFPRTRERLEARGFDVTSVDVSELAKAEGAVTCCSLLIEE